MFQYWMCQIGACMGREALLSSMCRLLCLTERGLAQCTMYTQARCFREQLNKKVTYVKRRKSPTLCPTLYISDVDQCWGRVKGSALNHSSPCTNVIRARVEGWGQGPSTSANIHSKVMGSVGWTVSCMLLDVDWARR